MKHLLSSLLVVTAVSLIFGSTAHAQRIIKVKGQQAIVQFPSGITPVVGETLSTGGNSGANENSASVRSSGTRSHAVSIMFANLSAYSSSAGGSITNFNVAGSYGWNLRTIEFGPIINIQYHAEPGLTNQTLAGGAYFDFNFVPNDIGQSFIYGVGAYGTFGQQTQAFAGIAGSPTTITDLAVMGSLKWFGLSDHICLRGDAGLDINRSSVGGSPTTNTGLLVRGGLIGYF